MTRQGNDEATRPATSLASSEDRAHQADLLATLVRGRRWIVATDVLVSSAAAADRLTELGAADVLLIGGTRGTGELDPAVEARALVFAVTGATIMGGIRAFEALLDDPPGELVTAVEAFDPDGDALVLTTLVSERSDLLGRPVFGARPEAWRRLEDKTVVDALWDRAGVPRAPSRIVPARATELRAAAAELDAGAGTMWVADNRSGWHGGGESARWVRDDADAEVAASYLGDIADVARVMPFLDGLPCSIHGWVVGDEVVTFRPCEMLVLRVAGRSRLRYAGASTAWRPAESCVTEMRAVASAVGRQLREEVGYRGVFTVDGVLTTDGFRPTELNPRFGMALGLLGQDAGLPLYLLHCATIVHPELDWRPEDLRDRILAASERAPVAASHTLVPEQLEQGEVPFRRDGDRLVAVGEDVERDGVLQHGPSATGGLVRVAFDRPEVGPSVAPGVARGFAFAREVLGVDLPDLEPAPDLHPAS